MNPPVAGWQPDPSGRHDYRYWDGAAWTDDVSDNGQTSVDPMGGAGAQAAGGAPTAGDTPTTSLDPTQQYGAGPQYGATPDSYGAPPTGFGPPTAGYGTQPGSFGPPPATGYGAPGPTGFGPPGSPSGQYPPGASSGQYPPGSDFGQPVKKGPSPALIAGLVALLLVFGGIAGFLAFGGGDDEEGGTDTDDTTGTTTADTTDTTPATTATTEATTTTTSGDPEDTNVFTLAVGDCLVDPGSEGEVSEVPVVPCEQPHTGEIFYAHIMTNPALPAEAEMQGIVDTECVGRFEGFVGIPYEDSALSVSWLSPTAESWDAGDRELLCIVNGPSNEVVGSLANTNR